MAGTPDDRYAELIAREASHWDQSHVDPANPQVWDDPVMRRVVIEGPYEHLVARAVATGGPALELGCGDGDLSLELARRGLDVTGLDLSPARVARANVAASVAGLGGGARFEVADLNTCELPRERYGCVVAHDALHHILHLGPLLDRAAASLRAGGRLVVSDFRGAGRLEKLATAAVVAVLPTAQPYAAKWRLRGRLRALLASEREKREALERGGTGLHDASPFEAITQESILPAIAARFDVVEAWTFFPFWYNAVPKLRAPLALKRAVLGAAQRLDRPLNRRGWTHGSYVFVEAVRR